MASFTLAGAVQACCKLAQPCITRSTASGLLGRSRAARRASALTSATPKRICEARDKLHLHFTKLAELTVEPVGPQVCAGLGRNELGVQRNLVADAAHAAFKKIAHAELSPGSAFASTDLPL